MSDIVKIIIDLNNGSINIEAPSEALDKVFDRLESFLPSLIEAREQFEQEFVDTEAENIEEAQQEGGMKSTTDSAETLPSEPKTSPKKRSASSKPESLKAVDLGLTADDREEFRQFYQLKKPQGQSQHVLTVIYWLMKNTSKTFLTKDEIFTGLRIVGEKVPKRLISVLSNLAIDSMIIRNKNEFSLHHIGEDFVEHDLPKQA